MDRGSLPVLCLHMFPSRCGRRRVLTRCGFLVISGCGTGPFLGPTLMRIRMRCLGLFCSGERVEAGAWPFEGSGVVLLPRGCGRPRIPLAEGAGKPLVLPRGTLSEQLPPQLSKDGLWPAVRASRSLGSGWLSCRGLPGVGAPPSARDVGGWGSSEPL